jgi:hypothetical protein
MITCIFAWITHSALAAVPRVVQRLITCSFIHRLRRARGRVSPLIPPGSPPPWDTSTIHTRQGDLMHRPRWEGRFAGTRRTCYNHLVSAATNWHLQWWLFLLALQWMVVALLDIGARLLNYRVAIRSYCETLPLLGEETPTAASAAAIGRWMTRWLRRSHDGARRHLNHSLRTLARALLVLSTYLLYHLSTHGISGLTRGMLGWLETWLVTILLPLPRRTSDALRAAHSILWLCQLNATYRGLIVLARLQDILGWFLFASRFALALLAVAWQHWTGPRALSVTPLPRAARSRPEASAVAVAAATAAATAATALQPPQPHSPPSPPSETTGDFLLRDLCAGHRPRSHDLRRVLPGITIPLQAPGSADGRLGAGHAIARCARCRATTRRASRGS